MARRTHMTAMTAAPHLLGGAAAISCAMTMMIITVTSEAGRTRAS
jgi:hypothetical protein